MSVKAAVKTKRVVEDDEEIPTQTLLEKFHEGAIWYGLDEMNIGWPDELHIKGSNLIRLLTHLRDEHYEALQGVKRALDSHHIPSPEGLSEADRIHLLVGRRSR
jgi:hypothetical protein